MLQKILFAFSKPSAMPSWHLNVWLAKQLIIFKRRIHDKNLGHRAHDPKFAALENPAVQIERLSYSKHLEQSWQVSKTSKSISSFKFYSNKELIADFLDSSDLY